jgi:hypothetical protein
MVPPSEETPVEGRMFEQKAISIPKDWGLQAFADAVEAILGELATERWESRIFQLGPQGLLIVARRPRFVDIDDLMMLDSPDWQQGTDVEEQDDLAPATREMLDKIFDLVGPVSLHAALEGMPSAVHGVARLYPPRFLEEAWSELQRHHEQHLREHNEGEEACEYAQVVAVVLESMREGLRLRLN